MQYYIYSIISKLSNFIFTCIYNKKTFSTKQKTILLTVYNPTVARNYILRVKVPHSYLKVIDTDNNELVSDVFCPNITDSSDCDLYAYVSFDAFSVHYYKVVPIESNENYVVP